MLGEIPPTRNEIYESRVTSDSSLLDITYYCRMKPNHTSAGFAVRGLVRQERLKFTSGNTQGTNPTSVRSVISELRNNYAILFHFYTSVDPGESALILEHVWE